MSDFTATGPADEVRATIKAASIDATATLAPYLRDPLLNVIHGMKSLHGPGVVLTVEVETEQSPDAFLCSFSVVKGSLTTADAAEFVESTAPYSAEDGGSPSCGGDIIGRADGKPPTVVDEAPSEA